MDGTLNLIHWAERELKRSNVRCARHDAIALFMDTFKMPREDLFLMRNLNLPPHRLNLFKHCVKLRASRYPLQYILGNTEFMGLLFALEEGVFIPRPETELLVEKVSERIKSIGRKRINMLDLGTGCGNIAISLTKNITGCKIISSDISDKALRRAEENARFHGADKDIKFIKSSLFDNIPPRYYNYFDIIASNPPYVRTKDAARLEPELLYEGMTALDGGDDGLYFYRRILYDGLKYLKSGGIFAFEIGYGQSLDMPALCKNKAGLSMPEFFKDYRGYDRVAIIKYHSRLLKI